MHLALVLLVGYNRLAQYYSIYLTWSCLLLVCMKQLLHLLYDLDRKTVFLETTDILEKNIEFCRKDCGVMRGPRFNFS